MNTKGIGAKVLAVTMGLLATGCQRAPQNTQVADKALKEAIEVVKKRRAEFITDSLTLSKENPKLQALIDSLDSENEFAHTYIGELMMDPIKTFNDLKNATKLDTLGQKYQTARENLRKAQEALELKK